jgi:hypothetical protein
MSCPRCNSEAMTKDGTTQLGGQRFSCNHRHRRFTRRSTSAFSGRPSRMTSSPSPSAGICATVSVTPKSVNGWPSVASWSIRAPSIVGCNAICHCLARQLESIEYLWGRTGEWTKPTLGSDTGPLSPRNPRRCKRTCLLRQSAPVPMHLVPCWQSGLDADQEIAALASHCDKRPLVGTLVAKINFGVANPQMA